MATETHGCEEGNFVRDLKVENLNRISPDGTSFLIKRKLWGFLCPSDRDFRYNMCMCIGGNFNLVGKAFASMVCSRTF